MRTEREGGRLQAQRREASGETKSANTLTLDFQTPERWENKFLLFNPPSPWYFVMAALANKYMALTCL